MKSNKVLNKINSDKKLKFQTIMVAFTMAIGMTLYEISKQVISPDITIWQSHFATIVFSTAIATVVSFCVLRKHIEFNKKIIAKEIESELLNIELENTVEQLENTLSKIKTLSGLLPICASCKKIRDDKGNWNQIELYIKERSEVDFSHSICPDCQKKIYPELYIEKENVSAQ